MNDAKDDLRDPQVSRTYARASRGEPPPALDVAVLAAAHAAVAPAARPVARPWWRRLQAPLALAATLVLAVALTLTVDRNPPPDASLPPAAPIDRPAIRKTPATPERNEAADRSAPTRAPSASPTPTAPAPAATAPRAAPAAKSEAAAPVLQAKPPVPIASPSAPAESGAPSPSLRSSEASQADNAQGERRKSAGAPSAATRAGIAPPDPEAWIAEIRALLRAGQNDEAAQRLREFRAAWPEYPLPADLRLPGQ
jgi:hypothetical protein